jgi:murein DD-endopeptidase MepM/ murein hydrolase activator NlpD
MLQRRWVFLLVILGVMAVGGGILWYYKLEGTAPVLTITPEPKLLGKRAAFVLHSEDERSGLKQVNVEIIQGGKTVSLLSEVYPSSTNKIERSFEVVPSSLDLKDGPAMMRAEARDRSWRHGGNPNIVELSVTIDTRPPNIEVLSQFHYVNQGGTGLVVYRASEDLAKSGVLVGDLMFPGFPMGNGGYIAFFAVPHDAPKEISIVLLGEDLAENRTQTNFNHRLKPTVFRQDRVVISDDFLARIMPYFSSRDPSLSGTPIENFIKINRDLRKANEEAIRKLCLKTAAQPLWTGAFLQMANSKNMARFADRRTYIYSGKEVDKQVHLGVDLASVAMAPVEAANRGIVAFTGEMGIYGNMVLLDHGCGLFSMYAHLSRIDVEPGQMLEPGQILGATGSTGLAGGDHLHFSMLVSGVYVNPIEWWDPHWVEDNISSKLAELSEQPSNIKQ